MNFGIERIFEIDPWNIVEKTFHPEKNEVAESVFTLANEYMGVRGNFEEGFDGETLSGSYIGGIFVKEKSAYPLKRKAFPTYTNTIVNTTNWLEMTVEVDGCRFSMSKSKYSDYDRRLDMEKGILRRCLVFETESGYKTQLSWERIVSHHDCHMAAIRLKVKAIGHAQPIKISAALDSTVENRELAKTVCHFREVSKAAEAGNIHLLNNVRSTGQYFIHRMKVDTHGLKREAEKYTSDTKRVEYSFEFTPKKDAEYNVDKITSVWTSRDAGYPYSLIPKESDETRVPEYTEKKIVSFLLEKSDACLGRYANGGYDTIKGEHCAEIGRHWEKHDVQIFGDEAAQQGIRFCVFQLFSTYLGNDSYLNIGAKGLSSEIYWGRTFWDSESYCLPFYLFTNPAAAKKLIEYRYNTLEAARQRARLMDYAGAMYPMTTIDGTEDCDYWEYSFCEIHINSTVAYTVFLYDHIIGDKEFLYSKGVEMLIEISRFWLSRGAYIPYRQGFGINRVIGPDEWQQFVNNNYYTNDMARWVFEYTIQVIQEMRKHASSELLVVIEKTGFDFREMENWKQAADKMILNSDEKLDILVQDDMFLSLDPIFREELDRERDIPIEKKWTVEKYYKYQLVKQPDILLLMFLFPEKFSLNEKQSNYRFYEQRTGHGSSLSPCIHSIIGSEIGRYHQAYEYYLWASRLDLDDFNNNTSEGLHISSMAGTWLNIICGFGQMKYTGDVLEFAPYLPGAWEKYSFSLVYNKSVINLTVTKEQVSFKVVSGQEVRAKIHGREVVMTAESQSVAIPDQVKSPATLEGVIFDLDGVIVDTAKFHYAAWKELADEEGIYFDKQINERLKGVSRMDSLDIIMEKRNHEYSEDELNSLADRKNDSYVKMLSTLTPDGILAGIPDVLAELRQKGVKIALCSASKNTDTIIDKLQIRNYFDAVVTGNDVSRSKPDPEGLLLAAECLGVSPANCLVVEDALAGVEAAANANMKSIGIGTKADLYKADYVLPSTNYLNLRAFNILF